MSFPYITNRVSVTNDWSIYLPFVMNLRVDEGSLVLWRPGFTIWLDAMRNDNRLTQQYRKQHFQETADPQRYDEYETSEEDRLYFSYRLAEPSEDKRAPALYGFAFGTEGHLQIAFYFDEEEDAAIAHSILTSANQSPAALPNIGIFSSLCFVSKQVLDQGEPVAYMYRETPDDADDSGWRFFSGKESQEYVDDPENILVCPIAFVAEHTTDIVPLLLNEPGAEFEYRNQEFVSV
jgi:hypothetical protein